MKNKFSLVIIFFLIFIFLFSVYEILNSRFKKGDIYLKYSSLRHDPMGTSIFFQSLEKMDIQVEVNTEEKLPSKMDPEDTILFYLSPSFYLTKEAEEDIISFILRGGRVLVTTQKNNRLLDFFDTKIESIKSDDDEQDEEAKILEATPDKAFVFLNGNLKMIPEFSLICQWPKTTAVYRYGDWDMVLLLNHGKGDIIMASDSYFISNESLAKDPPVAFLSWILDGRKHAIVDEYHHGTYSQKGISFLLQKYNLYWFIGYLIFVFCLYLWHVLPHFQKPIPRFLQEKSYIQSSLKGYTFLLEKTVPKKKLLDLCIQQWIKGEKTRFFKEKNKIEISLIRDQIQWTNMDKDEDIVEQYHKIAYMIQKQRRAFKP